MKSIVFSLLLVVVLFSNCKKKEQPNRNTVTFESTEIANFFKKYPKLNAYQAQVTALYTEEQHQYIWFDEDGKIETADVLHDRINNIDEEGIPTAVPYKDIFNEHFEGADKLDLQTELFLTTYYVYYTTKVNRGISELKSKQLGWHLPRKKLSYASYLDTLLTDPKEITKSDHLIPQYYKLKETLKQYRAIEQKGGWRTITTGATFKALKLGDSSAVVAQIRTRMFLTKHLASDSKSTTYDAELEKGILKYKANNGFEADATILPKHIEAMNVPVSLRIKTLIVNMERCRWISPDITKSKALVVVNVPSYTLTYFRDEKVVLTSNVVVGTDLHKTVIFSGMMRYVVFSPYWNVPKSILNKEILPGIEKNKNYLANHNMEWHEGYVRQQPGPKNSLGLVKFLFPNSNNIYLHDSPAKGLYDKEDRAFSHGCIRVAKAKELANAIMKKDADWNPEKVAAAMSKGDESWYTLKSKIPVYIGYFTSWVDNEGNVNFYDDVYKRDNKLAKLLMSE